MQHRLQRHHTRKGRTANEQANNAKGTGSRAFRCFTTTGELPREDLPQ